MELQNLLNEAKKERYKAEATIEAIGKELEHRAEKLTFEKYANEKLYTADLMYELNQVQAGFQNHSNSMNETTISLILFYFCTSKLPKAKRDKLTKAKETLKNEGYLYDDTGKAPLWKKLHYLIKDSQVFSGKFELQIEED